MAGEEQLPMWLIMGGTAVILCLGFLMGKFFDLDWRCNIMRRFTKSSYLVLNVLDKDNRFMKRTIVNTTDDTATIGTAMWVLTKGRIYEEISLDGATKKRDSLFNKIDSLDEKLLGRTPGRKGFQIQERHIKYRNGAPQLFVDYDSITPRDFYATSTAIIKPNEIGATLQAWVYNQIAKGFSQIANLKIIMYVMVALLAGNIILGFISMNNSAACMKTAGEIKSAIVPNVTNSVGTVQGGSLVVDQTKQTGGK